MDERFYLKFFVSKCIIVTLVYVYICSNLKNFGRTSFWHGFKYTSICWFISNKESTSWTLLLATLFYQNCSLNCWFWLWSVKFYQCLSQYKLIIFIKQHSTSRYSTMLLRLKPCRIIRGFFSNNFTPFQGAKLFVFKGCLFWCKQLNLGISVTRSIWQDGWSTKLKPY